jgi:carotenoid cleavage dioxygenase
MGRSEEHWRAAQLERRSFIRGAITAGGALAAGGLLAACSDETTNGAASSTSGATVPTTTPTTMFDPAVPYWQQGNFAAIDAEVEAFDLPVTGALPPALQGLYVRNGSNPRSGTADHWFLGDGMLHGVRLDESGAYWYRNRWVRTPAFEAADGMGLDAPPGRENNPSNTSVVFHAGKLLSLCEVGWPYEIAVSDLSTIGAHDYAGKLASPFTAHPKIHPGTGDMHFFGYGFAQPYLTYHVADASGTLLHSAVLDIPASSMIHDFAITETHAVFWDLPVLFDLELVREGKMPYSWQPDNGARVGVLPLGGTQEDIRWVEIDPVYVFHSVNAFNDGDDIVLDVCEQARAFTPEDDLEDSLPTRWRIGTAGADLTFASERTSERTMELPTIDKRFQGSAYRYGWYADVLEVDAGAAFVFGGVTRRDHVTGDEQRWVPPAGVSAGEGLFVPDEGGAEGEGWVLTYTYDAARDGSDLVVLDATDVAAGPVATVELPQRVPCGFHATWVPSIEPGPGA